MRTFLFPKLAALLALVAFLVAWVLPGLAEAAPKILFMPGVADPFYFTMEKGIQAKAKALGAELTVAEYPKSWGPEAQIPILQATIARQKFDLLLVAPTSTDALKAPLKAIYDKGVEIITVDTFIGDGDYANGPVKFPISYIGSDNVQGGNIACTALAEAIGKKGKVYIQNVKPGISTTDQREQGCKDSPR